MEETNPSLSAQCPHCRRPMRLDEGRAREGAIFECSWPDCARQVTYRRGTLVPPSSLLRVVLGKLPKPKG